MCKFLKHEYIERFLDNFENFQSTCTLTVCYCHYFHVTYAFQSESTLNSCLNLKEHFAQNRRDI